ncbi:MAG: symmetrical bis(5'-nucleosyl)-tetraphosphatase [Proteobacteria bacterium]|nr:symmetrical bis(5'-nucleosyl)-tetraphosphatase [Pseudomonadota bacterium]
MAIYAIGDVQGCFDELTALVEKIEFDPKSDELWFVGDLVNRGPKSLETLRWVKSLGGLATTVLGNHDLHLLAAHAKIKPTTESSSLNAILDASDADELVDWLRQRPLIHFDSKLNIAMVHAGVVPQWSIENAIAHAHEVERVLRSGNYMDFLNNMYGDRPKQWDETLSGWERLRVITNSFTRLRYCDPQGVMSLAEKGPPGTQGPGVQPWYEVNSRKSKDTTIVFGHWSTLGYQDKNNVIATDTGCLWGGALTAVNISGTENRKYQIACEAKRAIPAMASLHPGSSATQD